MSQKLRGLVAQGIDGRKKKPLISVDHFPPGSYTFRPRWNGYYKFHAWGSGGPASGASTPGASAAYAEKTVLLNVSQTVAIVVDRSSIGGSGGGGVSGASTCTFPDGSVLSAGSGNGNTPGSATGGDVNTAGVAGVDPVGGSAPGTTTMRGGLGGGAGGSASFGHSPGGGAASGTNTGFHGGDGSVIVMRIPKP